MHIIYSIFILPYFKKSWNRKKKKECKVEGLVYIEKKAEIALEKNQIFQLPVYVIYKINLNRT